MNVLRRIFSFRLTIGLLVALGLGMGIYRYWVEPFCSAYRKYHRWFQQRDTLEQQIHELRLQVAQKKHFIRKMMIDRAFREYVSREQLKYLKANEYIIFFKQKECIK